jgi:hypothetical protein
MKNRGRTLGEKRDAERVARAERRVAYVLDQMVQNTESAHHPHTIR